MQYRFSKNKFRQKGIILSILILCLVLLLNSCVNQSSVSTQPPVTVTIFSTISPTYSYVNPDKTNLPDLPSYPQAWVKGSEGWFPPLPSGFVQPRLLSADEWSEVDKIVRNDNEASIQFKNVNVGAMLRYWVGYSGYSGHFALSESDIVSEKVSIQDGCWFYPALLLLYRERTDRSEELVGVDLATNKVVFSEGRGGSSPIKPPPTH
jgi:hypothetical protein